MINETYLDTNVVKEEARTAVTDIFANVLRKNDKRNVYERVALAISPSADDIVYSV